MSEEKLPEKNLHYIGLSGETVSKEIYDVVCGQRDRAEADLAVTRHLLTKLTASLHAITNGMEAKKPRDETTGEKKEAQPPKAQPKPQSKPVTEKPKKLTIMDMEL